MSSSNPKRPTFTLWLRQTGEVSAEELGALNKEWNQRKAEYLNHKTYTTAPVTWSQFVASKYPRKVLAYQSYLRVIGATPTFNKD